VYCVGLLHGNCPHSKEPANSIVSSGAKRRKNKD
jgi:hypothetical protein